ncbi:tetratricopeptide repeat protein [candidate division KSB3 bacterium]|uniref:Tetratricopeptide repeat protein n=1 Tax=candidate division KSB3 bacterium TaxID=2044937 RepID=A0A9D5JS03_9BACT|nr:tetratricopeptide repeat protein [candidate division KSB3 bacterium]MBD3323184.1 tetratricopeptide repeat protein [candidate division KSB3 bacterium]
MRREMMKKTRHLHDVSSHPPSAHTLRKTLQTGGILLCSLLLVLQGCHHPDALYQEPEQPPLDQGRAYEKTHQYAQAQHQYSQIEDIVVKKMTLNQLNAAWNSVNANIIHAQEAVAQQPRVAQVHLTLAQEYYHKGLLCSEYTRDVVGDYPRDFVFDEQEYWYTESLYHAKKALQLDPHLPEASLLIGEIYLANVHYDDALNTLKRLIVKHPEYAKGYYAIGKIYLDTKEYAKVERYFIRAIRLDPDLIDAYYLLGQYYLERQWFDYAAYTFLEILRKNPADTPTMELLIDACHEL